jgi:hypothetical protein
VPEDASDCKAGASDRDTDPTPGATGDDSGEESEAGSEYDDVDCGDAEYVVGVANDSAGADCSEVAGVGEDCAASDCAGEETDAGGEGDDVDCGAAE